MLTGKQKKVLLGIILCFAVGITVTFFRSRQSPILIETPPTSLPKTTQPSEKKEIKNLTLHVAGAVNHPGVYNFPPGSKVYSAIAAAGGSLPTSDLDRLNLASPLVDGQKLVIPFQSDKTSQTRPLQINSADVKDWVTIKGIGEKTAQRIINKRQSLGEFKSVDDLLKVKGIGKKWLQKHRQSLTI